MRKILFIMITLFVTLIASASSNDVAQAEALARRLSPRLAAGVRFESIAAENGRDVFRLRQDGDRVVISGNNAVAMAVGLNRYLNDYCHATVSWYTDVAVVLPPVLPPVDEPVGGEALVPQRFFLNYCTYGYSLPFWQWRDWERLIDWMALNGVNMPLAITGQEAVWYKVWTQLGMSDEQVRAYFTGPAYLPWHRMANIDAWCGPLPEQWLRQQTELQRDILARERALGMRPVLPAFAGHVPGELRRLFPSADIKPLDSWAGFADSCRTYFLNSEDPLYSRIQRMYLEQQQAMFGTDHIYGVDPFNEMSPPSFEPDYLNRVSRHIYESLQAVDPEAEWLQMAWFLYYQREDYTPERARAMLTGVPQGKMTMLDYYCEYREMWRDLDRFYGLPYIWCYLGNFGGNSGIAGNVKEASERLDVALALGGDNLQGIGSTLEGLDLQQFPYEHLLRKAWTVSDLDAIDRVADRHAGAEDPHVRQAWHLLYDSVLTASAGNFRCPLPCSYPRMGKEASGSAVRYNRASLVEAWRLLLESDREPTDAYTVDLVWTGRQLLGDLFLDEKQAFDSAFMAHDREAMQRHAATMRSLIADIDSLCACHPFATLDKSLAKARALGDTPALADYYEMNARRIITTWGGNLNDYACRNWSGLLTDYYAERWNAYIEMAFQALDQARDFDSDAFNSRMRQWQDDWAERTSPQLDNAIVTPAPPRRAITLSRALATKYALQIHNFQIKN